MAAVSGAGSDGVTVGTGGSPAIAWPSKEQPESANPERSNIGNNLFMVRFYGYPESGFLKVVLETLDRLLMPKTMI